MSSSATSSNTGVIIEVLRGIFRRKQIEPPALHGDTPLDAALGLESLDFAELIVRLEEEFGTDPFANGAPPHVRTIAELARIY